MPRSDSPFLLSDAIILQLLTDNQFAEPKILDKAQDHATKSGSSLYEVLIEQDVISDENLGQVIAEYYKLPFIRLKQQALPIEMLRIIPESVAEKNLTLVYGQNETSLLVATAQPTNQAFLSMVAQKAGVPLAVHYSTPRDIQQGLRNYKRDLEETFKALLQRNIATKIAADEKGPPVSQIVDTLITYAYESQASDIHLDPSEEQTTVRFRIDGVLHDVLLIPSRLHEQIVTRIKVMARLRTDEHLSAQDGKFQSDQKAEKIDVRVSIIPIVEGEKVVMRLLASHFRQFALQDLGMSPSDLEKIKDAITKPYGMILSTGPTGSGKTTSIYAILKLLNVREKNIATIEDPVEYEITGLNQIQVNSKTNLTFASGLRSILRQDPDIIYVGEIRDEETADIAINSATTGHLVVSTLHTNNAATTIPRLIDMKIEPFLIASTINVIIGQRLLRTICSSCKVSQPADRAKLEAQFSPKAVEKYFGETEDIRIYHGKGCPVCHLTGYAGRIGVFEILVMSPALQELVNQKADSNDLTALAIKEGMTTMVEDGLSKVQLGLTTVEEVLRATRE